MSSIILDFGKILLPAGLVLYAMYLTMKSMLAREMVTSEKELKSENNKTVLPSRLQAFERMCLFLERLSPGHLVLRLNTSKMSAAELQHLMIAEIREEFNHNLSQQIYMSDETWNIIKETVEEIIAMINASAHQLDTKATSVDLAKVIFNEMEQRQEDPAEIALRVVKAEVRKLF